MTAVNGEKVNLAQVEARQASREIQVKQKSDLRTRDQANATLRKRLTGVLKELRMMLPSDSETWLAFGLKIPSDRVSPAVKERAAIKAQERAAQKAQASAEKSKRVCGFATEVAEFAKNSEDAL